MSSNPHEHSPSTKNEEEASRLSQSCGHGSNSCASKRCESDEPRDDGLGASSTNTANEGSASNLHKGKVYRNNNKGNVSTQESTLNQKGGAAATTIATARAVNRDELRSNKIRLSIPSHVNDAVSQNWVVKVSTRAMCHYLLYARGVVPTPIYDMWTIVNEDDDSSCSRGNGFQQQEPHALKKMKVFATSLDALWNHFDLLLSSFSQEKALFQPLQVLITLGPAWSRPKEHYLISWKFDADNKNDKEGKDTLVDHDGNESKDTNMEDEKENLWKHALSRRLVREMVEQDHNPSSPKTSAASSSNQLFLSVQVTSQTAHSLLVQTQEEQNENDESNVLPLLLSNRLVVRHGFSLTHCTETRSKKKNQPDLYTVHLESPNLLEQDKNAMANLPPGADEGACHVDEDTVWLSFRTKVKGFRL